MQHSLKSVESKCDLRPPPKIVPIYNTYIGELKHIVSDGVVGYTSASEPQVSGSIPGGSIFLTYDLYTNLS